MIMYCLCQTRENPKTYYYTTYINYINIDFFHSEYSEETINFIKMVFFLENILAVSKNILILSFRVSKDAYFPDSGILHETFFEIINSLPARSVFSDFFLRKHYFG